MSHRAIAWSALTFAAWMLAAGVARADEQLPTCESLAAGTDTTPLYVSGSQAADPLLERVAVQLARKRGIAVIYKPTNSCTALNQIALDPTKNGCADGRCISGNAIFLAYPTGVDTNTTRKACTLASNETHIDVALSDVHYETCSGGPSLPMDQFAWLRGPAVAMTFAVPTWVRRTGDAAQATGVSDYISDDEAYSTFGLMCGGGVAPWTDASVHFVPKAGSGVTEILARAIGVPPTQLWGTDVSSDGTLFAIRDALRVAASMKRPAIGFLPSSFLDDVSRSELTPLAFRAKGQHYAFTPDSGMNSHDKLNMRQGRYVPFGYLHLFIRRSDTTASSPTRTFYELFSGLLKLDGFDIRNAAIDSHFVPGCAMQVVRTSEQQNERGFFTDLQRNPDFTHSCSCNFDARLANTPNTVPFGCTACTSGDDCKGDTSKPNCVDNFCTE